LLFEDRDLQWQVEVGQKVQLGEQIASKVLS